MASFRRTLSLPYPDSSSPSHKLPSNAKYSSPSPALVGLRRFFAGVFIRRYTRNGQLTRTSIRCLLFFLLGFLLGMYPFGHIGDEIRRQDVSFEIKPVNVVTKFALKDHALMNLTSLSGEKHKSAIKRFNFVPRKQLIVVTPTYNRPHQSYFLNRLAQVIQLVPQPILWIVVEMNAASSETAEILRKTNVMYRHLVCTDNNLTNVKDRGVHQRNTALDHIERHRLDGIIYFADDDNIYSLELFQNIRDISRFGTWPVAMLAQRKNKAILEGPVCNGSDVIGWHTNDKSRLLRRFHADMSGFAFNSTILWDSRSWRRPSSNPIRQFDTVKEGFQETTFIEQLLEDESQMEGSPHGCSKIMNWHLHLDASNIAYPKDWLLLKNLDAVIPLK